jgi:hypothetical protein
MGAVLAAALAAPLLVQHRADVRWRVQRQASRQQAVSLDQLSAENERLSNVVARVKSSQSLSDAQLTELLKLRNEAGQLRRALMEINTLRDRVHRLHDRLEDAAKEEEGRDNYTAQLADEMPKRQARVARLRQWLEGMPAEKIPELKFLSEDDWMAKVDDPLVTDDDYRTAMVRLRARADADFAQQAFPALKQYAQANNGQFPTDLSQLEPYFASPIDAAILQRYEIVPTKSLVSYLADLGGDWLITEKAPINQNDSRVAISLTGFRSTIQAGRWDPGP